MTHYQQNTLLLALASILNTLFGVSMLLAIGWTTFFGFWTMIGSAGCLTSAYRIFFSKTNIY